MQLLCRIIVVSLIVLDVAKNTRYHGRKKVDEYNACTTLIASLIVLGLLLGGGFFS